MILRLYVCVLILLTLASQSWSCNEAVCGPIVTLCQLVKRCDCEMPKADSTETCECCADCAACLEDKYPVCCSCVGMCEPPETSDPSLVNASSVEDLREPIPALFSALTTNENSNSFWTVHRYPAYESLLNHNGIGVQVDKEQSVVKFTWDNEILSTVKMENCSVAYMKDCLSLARCKEMCKSMGAAKFRWFHDQGCCECVGDKCIDYGKNYAQCERCLTSEEGEETPRFDEL